MIDAALAVSIGGQDVRQREKSSELPVGGFPAVSPCPLDWPRGWLPDRRRSMCATALEPYTEAIPVRAPYSSSIPRRANLRGFCFASPLWASA